MAKSKTIHVTEHNEQVHVTEVENFNAKGIHLAIKEAQGIETNDNVVVIGDIIIDARSIKSVVVVQPAAK